MHLDQSNNTKGKLQYMIPMKVVAKCFWVGIAIVNGCFYHDIFSAAMVSSFHPALSLRDANSLAFSMMIRGSGATSNKRYCTLSCNKLALSSLVNNQNETNR
jgi:hypothetical protein